MRYLLPLLLIFLLHSPAVATETSPGIESHALKFKIGKRTLQCELTLPDKGKDIPLLIWSPGGDATTAYLRGYRNLAARMGRQGVAVLQVAFNGDSARDRAANFKLVMDKVKSSTRKAFKRIRRNSFLLGGHSRGGAAAYAAAIGNDDVVAFMGYNASHPLALGDKPFPTLASRSVQTLLLVGDQTMKGQYVDRNAADAYVKLVSGPVVMIQFKGLDHNLAPATGYDRANDFTASWLEHVGLTGKKPKALGELDKAISARKDVIKHLVRDAVEES